MQPDRCAPVLSVACTAFCTRVMRMLMVTVYCMLTVRVLYALQVPQEDELAVNVLSRGTSYYMPLVFMKQEKEFRDFVSFKTAASEDRERWCNAFTFFLKKLTVRTGKKRILLKSPVHTGRVDLFLQLFPKAQFVYIHRNPYTVFQSAKHMAATTYWYVDVE